MTADILYGASRDTDIGQVMLNRGRTHAADRRRALRLWHAARGSVRITRIANTVLYLLLSAWSAQTWAQCTNCTTTLVGGDVVHTWTASGTFTPPAGVTSVQVLVVGGGGGGGFPIDRTGGGGGGGGLISNAAFAVAGTQTVTIGAGGNGGTSGSGATAGGNSVFGSLTAIGGGRGGTGPSVGGVYATAGGSGGGGYHNPSDSGKAGMAGQGNAGGSGYDSTIVTVGFKAGGGGGAGGAGTTATPTVNGAGGAGLQSSISGTATFYAGGGGGGIQVYTGTAPGGSGVGGDGRANGLAGTAGMANRGGGGGGGSQNITTSATGNGGNGGSGIVIVRYSLNQSQTMSPGACTSLGGSGRNWMTPGNAVSSNNIYATSQTLDGQVTDPLQCLNFGFSIPLTATVNGIQVFVERKSSSTANGGSRDDSLFLVKTGVQVGTDLATTTAYITADVVEAHGGSSEMWGTTWTPAQINANNFGAVFTATKPSTAGGTQTITVDHIFITVYYTISSPVVLPDSFDAVEVAAAPNTPIRTKLSGAGFTLDVLALDTGGNILSGYLGTVTVEIVNAATGGGVCAAMTSLQNLGSFAFIAGNAGRRSINTFNYANAVPNARIRMTDATAEVTACSSDNFAIRPGTFGNFSVTDNDWQTAGTVRALATTTFAAGGILHKAGRPFTVRADALNAAGVPAVTTGYTGSPATAVTACAGAACTPTFGTLTLGTGFTSGQLNTSAANYNEVGSFRLQLVDSTFAAVDIGDSTALEREIRSAQLDVGRFVPDHFDVSLNTPAFAAACGSGGFSYVGQLFSYSTQPVMTVTARNFAGNATALYAGTWWRISNGSLTPGTQVARYPYLAVSGTSLDVSNLPAVAGDPAVASTGSGVGTLTFSSGTTGLLFSRGAPVTPFNADISLAVNVIDADGVSYAGNPARFGQDTAGNGIPFLSGKQMRYGRLRLGGANGSPSLPLRVPVEAQYWNGSAFVTNIADTCTTLSIASIGLGNYILNPLIAGSGTTSVAAVTSPLSAGRSVITLNKPAANVRSVDVAVNLGSVPPGAATADACPDFAPAATAASKPYLRGNWCTPPGTYTKDPAARARFGIQHSSDEAIYTRENTN